jgi:hypothetical protein
MFNKIEKISCIIIVEELTTDILIKSFESQVYPNKELVVLTRIKCDINGHLNKQIPNNLQDLWAKDLAIELTSGDLICWWEKEHHPFYLSYRVKKSFDENFFPKQKFYESQNMLYCQSQLENEEYYEI